MDGISTVKFAYIQWVGENVKPMAKAKVSTHKGALENHFKVSVMSIQWHGGALWVGVAEVVKVSRYSGVSCVGGCGWGHQGEQVQWRWEALHTMFI